MNRGRRSFRARRRNSDETGGAPPLKSQLQTFPSRYPPQSRDPAVPGYFAPDGGAQVGLSPDARATRLLPRRARRSRLMTLIISGVDHD